MQNLVVLSGAGMSAESGIATFRGANGLWQGHPVEQVASPEGWKRNPELVLDFYNQRRKKLLESQPNLGHRILAEAERRFKVSIITQNVDDLHERAGSTRVLHLHGLLTQSRSSKYSELIYPVNGWELKLGDLCERGFQLRPNIVWFGESVPLIETAAEICETADLFAVVGTSLVVYPAAGLIDYVPCSAKKYVIDPHTPDSFSLRDFTVISEVASRGLQKLFDAI